MPNWCQNRLTITVPESENNEYQDTIKVMMLGAYDDQGVWQELSFERLIPQPDFESEEVKAKASETETAMFGSAGTMPSWWTWRVANWGTKWDACEVQMETTRNKIYVSFDTAWSPPLPWYNELAAKLKELGLPVDALEYVFIEYGGGFCGIYRNGVLTESEITEETEEELTQDYAIGRYF